MRVAFVVQRYGPEVNGGAETLCRSVAERLQEFAQVEVLTTDALDHQSWAPHFQAGTSITNGVTIHRFPVANKRNAKRFERLNRQIFGRTHTIDDELAWMQCQGPETPELLAFIREQRDQYDAICFFTYLYATTYFGLQLAPHKAILVPTAHDEPPIHLDIFRPLFTMPRAIIYLTGAERDFVHRTFHNSHVPSVLSGIGIDEHPEADGNRFREKHALWEPFMLYAGRVEPSKNCDQLFAYFLRYKQENESNLKLVLLGHQGMTIPNNPDIKALGFVSEQEKFDALQAADLFVLPSKFESLSISSLEAWMMETPIIVNGRSQVLRDHCNQSNGGLYYLDYQEFAGAVRLLINRTSLRRSLGTAGKQYVQQHYNWERVEHTFLSILDQVAKA